MAESKYDTHVRPYLDRIAAWVGEGATAKEAAGKLHISYSTFRRYLDAGRRGEERYRALAQAFQAAAEEPDDRVEAALYKRACGMGYEERVYEQKLNKETGQYEEICAKRVMKFLPPDPSSAVFWLCNRRPGRWRHKPEPEGEEPGQGGGVIELAAVMDKPGEPGE